MKWLILSKIDGQRVNPTRGATNKAVGNRAQNPQTPNLKPIHPMKIKLLSTLILTLALGCSASFAEDEHTPLEKEMKTMNKSLRTLKKQAEDAAKKDENLALIATIKKSVEASAKLEPAETKKVPAGDKAAYLDKYKAQMADLAKSFDELEAAIKDGKAEEAKKMLAKLSEQKEKGHKDFAPDEK